RRDELARDTVIVTRGGGSREDLWAFNERIVADAAFAMHVPLVAAIGHEVDTSIIELVADLRASTPTQAAMLLLPDLVELRARHERLGRDLRNAMRWSIQSRRDALVALGARPELASPALRLSRERERTVALAARMRQALLGRAASRRAVLDGLSERLRLVSPASRASAARASLAALGPRLTRALAQRLAAESTALEHLGRRLRSAGPEETIRRGYAVVTDANGRLVRAVGGIAAGDDLAIRVADGTIAARVARTTVSETTEE
ncbi:MAG: exodeoxyribonuclease VII large subunit, partial [Phycisphaerales bacterium]